jgi:hypothetical protein
MADAKPDVLAIFAESLACESEEERSRYLDEACSGEPHIRDRVEALLRAHRDAGNSLGSPSPSTAQTLGTAPLAERPGMTIGRYKLVHEIGQGGLGVVFEAERQALAMMGHQCIAAVLDGDSTESRRPYFRFDAGSSVGDRLTLNGGGALRLIPACRHRHRGQRDRRPRIRHGGRFVDMGSPTTS